MRKDIVTELLDGEHDNQKKLLFMRVFHRGAYEFLADIVDNVLISIIIFLNKDTSPQQ